MSEVKSGYRAVHSGSGIPLDKQQATALYAIFVANYYRPPSVSEVSFNDQFGDWLNYRGFKLEWCDVL